MCGAAKESRTVKVPSKDAYLTESLLKPELILTLMPNVPSLALALCPVNTPHVSCRLPLGGSLAFSRRQPRRHTPCLSSMQTLTICCAVNAAGYPNGIQTVHEFLRQIPNLRQLTFIAMITTAWAPISRRQIENLSFLAQCLGNLRSLSIYESAIFDSIGTFEYLSKWLGLCPSLETFNIQTDTIGNGLNIESVAMSPRRVLQAIAPTKMTLTHLGLIIGEPSASASISNYEIDEGQLAQFARLETLQLSSVCLCDYRYTYLVLSEMLPPTVKVLSLVVRSCLDEDIAAALPHITAIGEAMRIDRKRFTLQHVFVEFDIHRALQSLVESHRLVIKEAFEDTGVDVTVKLTWGSCSCAE